MTKYYACPVCGCNSNFMRRKKRVCHECDKSVQKSLIDAVNLIAEYVKQNLPEYWLITLEFASDEVDIGLLDCEFDSHEFYTDRGISAIESACDEAYELQNGRR